VNDWAGLEMRLTFKAAAAACLLMLAPGAAMGAGVTIAAHRAVYDLRLKEASNKAGLAAVDGRMAFEIAGSKCDGWTINFRMVNDFKPGDGDPKMVDTQSATFESGDGKEMRYTQTEFVDNHLDTEKKLSAERGSAGQSGKGEIEKPQKENFELPKEAIFSTQHQLKLMQLAETGQSRDISVVFDGSDGSKAYKAITFIGKRKEPGKSGIALTGESASRLASVPSWPISISYFPLSSDNSGGEETPAYQVGFELFENGVAANLVLDYGEFKLSGELKNLEFLNQPACSN
jgi:EipB-like